MSNVSQVSTSVEAEVVVPPFHALRNPRRAWGQSAAIDSLIEALQSDLEHGFRRQDFRMDQLEALREAVLGGTPEDIARLDILASDVAHKRDAATPTAHNRL